MLNIAFSLAAETWTTIGMLVLLFVLLYFFMIRPQKKQQQRDEEMRGALQVGDEVTTIGGIIGKVISIKGETFVLESTKDKTKIRFLKGAIRNVDVKAADIAAQVMEANQEAENDANEFADADVAEIIEATEEKKASKKSKKNKKSKKKNTETQNEEIQDSSKEENQE